ncbi:echinoderm microtubule-associated protein-like CG42247 [Apis dorsata]|uniref:echinoderm microtubule-associated protein-like CG42247 n=1 Tax=Apis dorsata TaxID=7462 RepID=UPI0003DF675A|nr:echinoderm microtubule-associated protein-like CG42247 [Apis dorsata]
MIAVENQSSLRAGSSLGQVEEAASDGSVGGGSEAGGGAGPTTSSVPGVMNKEGQEGEVKNENCGKESTGSVTTPSGVVGAAVSTAPAEASTMPGGGARGSDEEEEQEEEEEDVEVEGGTAQEAVGGGVVASDGGGGGGMAGFWRQSRPSSPRMPPPEQPELTRPKSRHEPAPARYNNLGYWRARRVTFYKNGDPYFPGIEFRFKPGRDIGSLEALLDRLSLRMDLPRGARHIFSMDGDRKLTLDELEDGASYVVSSYKTFKVSERVVSIYKYR